MNINKTIERIFNSYLTMVFLVVGILGLLVSGGMNIIENQAKNSQELVRKVHSGELELHCTTSGDWRMVKVPANTPTNFVNHKWWFGSNINGDTPTCITRLPSKKVY